MLLKAQFVIFFLAIAADCSDVAEDKRADKHPRRVPYRFPLPFFTGYFDPSKPFRNRNPYETRHEGERVQYMTTTERTDDIKKMFQDESNKYTKTDEVKNNESLQRNKTDELKATKPTELPNPLAMWSEERFSEKAKGLINEERKETINTHSNQTQTDIESAIFFRDDDDDIKITENKLNDTDNQNRFSDDSIHRTIHSINNNNDTVITKNKDYFMVPATMPVKIIGSPAIGLLDNTNNDDTAAQEDQNIQNIPAVQSPNVVNNVQSMSKVAQQPQGFNPQTTEYFTVVPQNQGLSFASNNAPSNVDGKVLNSQANALFTVLNIPNNVVVQALNSNQQGVVYFLENQGNSGINLNTPSSTYQLVNIPNNNLILGQGSNVVQSNKPVQPLTQQNNIADTSNQPNNLYFLSNPANTNSVPLASSNQQNLVTFSNQQNLLPLNNQQNVQATNSLPLNDQANLVYLLNTPTLMQMNSQQNYQVTDSMPVNNQANSIISFSNRPNYFTLSSQPNVVTLTNLPNNMVAFTNQPTVVAYTNNPLSNQVSSMTLQTNNAIIPNFPANQPNNIVSLINQLSSNNNQAGNLANQGNNLGITDNKTPIQSNILATLLNQPSETVTGNLAASSSQPSSTILTNSQLSNLAVVPNISDKSHPHPHVLPNIAVGQENKGNDFVLMDTKDEVEEYL